MLHLIKAGNKLQINIYMLTIFCSGYGLGIGLRAAIMERGQRQGSLNLPEGQYLGHTLQATINLFINWFLGLTLTPGLTRPLWELLGHYGFCLAIMGWTIWAVLHKSYSTGLHGHKGQ